MAVAADDPIRPASAEQDVVAIATVYMIVAVQIRGRVFGISIDLIVAGASEQRVVATTAGEYVIARATVQKIPVLDRKSVV